jgi:phosphate transport system permease protein
MELRTVYARTLAGRQLIDRVFFAVLVLSAAAASLIMVLILWFLLYESWGFIANVGISSFFAGDGWWPLDRSYNLLPMVVASLVVTCGAILLAAPLAVIYAVFNVFYAPAYLKSSLSRLVDVVAAIPTVIYGFWGLIVVVPLVNKIQPPGVSLFAGIIVLAMMVFPTVTVLTVSALKSVPATHIQGAVALGVRKLPLILKIALPTAGPGVITAVVLGLTRAVGETMVVLMVCGNVVKMPGSIFDSGRALTANIALEMPYAMGDHRSSLFVTGLIVLLVVTGLVILCEFITRNSQKEL